MAQEQRPGPGLGLTDKQEQLSRLIARGASNSEACRIVGIHRRTGTRRRYGRSGNNAAGWRVPHPPLHTIWPPKPRHPRYLSPAERILIADLRGQGQSVHSIARALRRSPATISREPRRDAGPGGRCLPRRADSLAQDRTAAPQIRRLLIDSECREVVEGLLQRRPSPEQVAHDPSLRYPDQAPRRLCTQTVYQAI